MKNKTKFLGKSIHITHYTYIFKRRIDVTAAMDVAVVIFLVATATSTIVAGIMQQRFYMFKFKSENIKLKRKIITIKREKLKEIDLNLYSTLVLFWLIVLASLFYLSIFFYSLSVFVPALHTFSFDFFRFLYILTAICVSHLIDASTCPFAHKFLG